MKKTVSLTENHIFRRLYRVGVCKVTPCVAVYTKKNKQACNRLGVTASKKIGNAVQRNRARRVITEAYRLLEDRVPSGLDIVIVARKRAVEVKMQTVYNCLEKAFGDSAFQNDRNNRKTGVNKGQP